MSANTSIKKKLNLNEENTIKWG